MPKVQITKEAIEKALNNGAKSITEIYKALGGKSKVSGSFTKKIRTFCPNVDVRLKENQGKISEKPSKSCPVQKAKTIPTVKLNPFRPNSAYALVWNCLYQARKKGINRRDFLKQVMKLSHKPEKNCNYDISVVTSPREDGSCHRSAKTAADVYYIERQNDWLKLHLRHAAE